jgi:hypothetical protein
MRKTIVAAWVGTVAACGVIPPVPPAPPAPDMAQLRGTAADAAPAALAGEGRYGEAIALLERQARRQPSAALLGNLAYAYYLDGRPGAAQEALERACLQEPSNALAWERLAALLETQGETGRALEAMRQARMLRVAAAEGTTGAPLPRESSAGAGPEAGVDLWPAGMARVEVRQVGAGLVEVARVAYRPPAQAAVQAAAPADRPGATRLEVSNGNGIRGMAAAVAQRLRAEGMDVVRLTNTIPFNVEETRVEVRGSGAPLLRIVLGKDMAQAAPQMKKAARG